MPFGVTVRKGATGTLFGVRREGGDANGAGDNGGSLMAGLNGVGVGDAGNKHIAKLRRFSGSFTILKLLVFIPPSSCAVDYGEDEKPKVEIVP